MASFIDVKYLPKHILLLERYVHLDCVQVQIYNILKGNMVRNIIKIKADKSFKIYENMKRKV